MSIGGLMPRLAVLLLVGLACILPVPVMAHSYKSSGPVTVLLHVEPDDRPVAGGQSSLHFFLTDKTGQLRLADCFCRAVIRDGAGKEIILPLIVERAAEGNGKEALAGARYTFIKGGVYEIELLGTSKRMNGFEPFKVSYVQRVEAASQGAGLLSGISQGWLEFIVSLGLVGLLAVLVWGRHSSSPLAANDRERFHNPLLHYGFYVVLAGLAILILFDATAFVHAH